MPQVVLFVLVVAACLSLVYGRKAGQEFIGWVLTLLGALVIFVVGVGGAIYYSERREAAKVEATAKAAAAAQAAAVAARPAAPAPTPVYQRTAHSCSACGGTGTVACSACGGSGYRAGSKDMSPPLPPDCPLCGMGAMNHAGLGRAFCTVCRGSGQAWY